MGWRWSLATTWRAGSPGDATTAVLLYLAMTGLLVEHLTLPELLARTGSTTEDLVRQIVTTIGLVA